MIPAAVHHICMMFGDKSKQACGETCKVDCACCIQVLGIGKISQAAVVAASAYRNEDTFRRQTGITNSRLIDDKLHCNTKVYLFIGALCA